MGTTWIFFPDNSQSDAGDPPRFDFCSGRTSIRDIAESLAHRSIESSADPRRNSALDSCIADAMLTKEA